MKRWIITIDLTWIGCLIFGHDWLRPSKILNRKLHGCLRCGKVEQV